MTTFKEFEMAGVFRAGWAPLTAAVAFGLCVVAGPVAGADNETTAPKQPSVTIGAVPPSIQIDTAPADADESSGDRAERRKGRALRHGKIQIGPDGDYSSFSALMESDPWLAALIFLSVSLFFLVPIVLLIGIFWYKLRKVRMQNEAMIAMAEKGIVSAPRPAEAGAPAAPAYSSVPGYEQAIATRKRSGMSDLRKGALMVAAGLALSFWSILYDQSANSVGLVLLFVGMAYLILWWVEERKLPPHDPLGAPPR